MRQSHSYLIIALLWLILLHVTETNSSDWWAYIYIVLGFGNLAAYLYHSWKEHKAGA